MAELSRDREPNAPQNPPNSVVNPEARRKVFHTFFTPIVVFFVIVGIALVYWGMRPERPQVDPHTQGAEATTGFRSPQTELPGGKSPDPNPSSPREEIETRTGEPITELHGVYEERLGANDGRRVEIEGVKVERVESPTLFWVRDGNARLPVIAPPDGQRVSEGQTVDLVGTIQRSGTELRIRATRVEVRD